MVRTGLNVLFSRVHTEFDARGAISYDITGRTVRESLVNPVCLTAPPVKREIVPYTGHSHETFVRILRTIRWRKHEKNFQTHRDAVSKHVISHSSHT